MNIAKISNIQPINNVLIGSDPEYMVRDIKTNKPRSIVGLLGGTKDKPIYIDKHMSYQEDNVNVEYTVTPTTDYKQMLSEIDYLTEFCNGLLISKGVYIDKDTVSAEYEQSELNSKVAKLFGCSSSDNSWTLMQNESPDNTLMIRCCGGHFHISYDNPDFDTSIALARALDLYLGVPSILLDEDRDRRKLYGLAGEIRMTSYGVEYRVLSNHITQKEEYLAYYFYQINKAIEAVNNGLILNDSELALQIINCINTYNTQQAEYIMEQYNIDNLETFLKNKETMLETVKTN
jgi:hypothetical protein